jgi:hypothetical protein
VDDDLEDRSVGWLPWPWLARLLCGFGVFAKFGLNGGRRLLRLSGGCCWRLGGRGYRLVVCHEFLLCCQKLSVQFDLINLRLKFGRNFDATVELAAEARPDVGLLAASGAAADLAGVVFRGRIGEIRGDDVRVHRPGRRRRPHPSAADFAHGSWADFGQTGGLEAGKSGVEEPEDEVADGGGEWFHGENLLTGERGTRSTPRYYTPVQLLSRSIGGNKKMIVFGGFRNFQKLV